MKHYILTGALFVLIIGFFFFLMGSHAAFAATVTNNVGGLSVGFDTDQLSGGYGLALNGDLFINGPNQNIGMKRIRFGPNVDLQSNTAGSGPTFAVNSGEIIHSLLRRDIVSGVTGIAWIQGEGVNSAGSSYRPGAIEWVQRSNVAGAEAGEFRIYTKSATDIEPVRRLSVDENGVHMGGGTLSVVSGALQWTSPAGHTTVIAPN